jgi:uncharacterized protein YuzE
MTLERHQGTWTYDSEAGALYLYLNTPGGAPVVHAMDMSDKASVLADLDADGRVIGVEIVNPWPTFAVAQPLPEGETT